MADERITKDEKKALRKLEWEEKEKAQKRNEKIKKYSIWVGTIALVLAAIGGLIWLVSQPTPKQNSEAANVAPISGKDISQGPKNAKVTLIEYADFQCPACGAYHPIVHQLTEQYKDKILYVYRIFPLTNIHPNAHISAQAAYAAHKQGEFFQYDDYLYNNQSEWADVSDPKSIFEDYAKQLKLNVDKFKKDMVSDEAVKYVNNAEQQALSEGINATPTFILNGNKISNPNSLEEFQKLIDSELKSDTTTPTP